MLKEKYFSFTTIIAIIISIIFTITAIAVNLDNSKIYKQMEYINKIFDKSKVIEVDIIIDEINWNYLIENAKKEEYVPCDIVINGTKISTVGIRPKGNSSLSMVANDSTTDRFSFKLDFSQYIKGQNLYGLSKIALNNMIGDTTYMKEYLSYDMMIEMGINTPAYSFANINLNGEPWGLYLAVETLEDSFLQRYYGNNYGNLYKPESINIGDMGINKMPNKGSFPNINDIPNRDNSPNMNNMPDRDSFPDMNNMPNRDNFPDMNNMPNRDNFPDINNMPNKDNFPNEKGFPMGGSSGTNLVYIDDNLSSYSGIFDNTITKHTTDSDKKKVIEMIKNLNNGTNLEKYIDVDEVLRYFAVNTFLVNLDSYSGSMKHNYYLYEQDGKFQILPWDYNLSFGAFQMNDASKVINFPIDTPVTDSMERSPLISKLLEVDEYKNLYHQYLNKLINNYIINSKFDNTISNLDNLISEYIKNDKTAFYTFDEYKLSIEELKKFGKDRTESIKLQLNSEQPSKEYGNLETTLNLSALGTMGDNKNFGEHENNQRREIKFEVNENTQRKEINFTINEKDINFDNIQVFNINNNQVPQENTNPQHTIKQLGIIGIYLAFILIGIFFVAKFKRYKY